MPNIIVNIYIYIYVEWDLQVTDQEKSQTWRAWRPWVTSVSVPLRGFSVTRKHERSRRETEIDVTSELQKDWNDTHKPNFEAFVEADMQVIPSPP